MSVKIDYIYIIIFMTLFAYLKIGLNEKFVFTSTIGDIFVFLTSEDDASLSAVVFLLSGMTTLSGGDDDIDGSALLDAGMLTPLTAESGLDGCVL